MPNATPDKQAVLFDNAWFPALREQVRERMYAQCGPRETWMKPGVPIVACLSGGKDSTALAILLVKERPEWVGDRPIYFITNDTGWEHPITRAYGDYLRLALNINIVVPPPKYTFESLAEQRKMFPSTTRRFCTEELKVLPAARWMEAQGWDDFQCIVARGIRADESEGRKLAQEWGEFTDARKVYPIWNPLVEWTPEQVFDIHKRHGIEPNPLYKMGMKRVGCWPCIMASKQQLRATFKIDPDLLPRLRALEARVIDLAATALIAKGKHPTARSFFRTDKTPPRFHSGRSLDSEGNEFTYPTIDDVYRWCMEDGDDDPAPDEGGCVSMYGLCE